MKIIKKRWEEELDKAVPKLNDEVKNAPIAKSETDDATKKTPWLISSRIKRMIPLVACGCALLIGAIVMLSSLLPLGAVDAPNPQKRIMNISINPSVEFVLDEEDKVITVNALNEEGNLIIGAESFVGKTAEEAARLFVEISKETGFIVEGETSLAENKVSVAFSGEEETATQLYNQVKTKIESYLTSENVTVIVEQAAAITEEQLEKLVAECAPYMEEAEVKALEYMELVETLCESRKETAEFYSQELKNAYYEAKAFVLEQAELEILKTKVSGVAQIALNAAYSVYSDVVEGIEKLRMQTLVNEDSAYQVALKNFREAKIAYLNYREEVAAMEQTSVTAEILKILNAYEEAVNMKEQALLSAGESANAGLDMAKEQMKTAYEAVVKLIEQASVKASEFLGEISVKQQAAKEQFFIDFETNYAAAIASAKESWATMKNSLQADEKM